MCYPILSSLCMYVEFNYTMIIQPHHNSPHATNTSQLVLRTMQFFSIIIIIANHIGRLLNCRSIMLFWIS